MIKNWLKVGFFGLALMNAQPLLADRYLSKTEFLSMAFGEQATQVQTLWLDKALQTQISSILDHQYPKLRLKYWQAEQAGSHQTVWFLDEIGKERPISFGISVRNQKVQLIEVLEYRESRGGEIKMRAFSDQFINLSIDQDNDLNGSIDGITGATMSVNAMKKVTRLALMLDRLVNQ